MGNLNCLKSSQESWEASQIRERHRSTRFVVGCSYKEGSDNSTQRRDNSTQTIVHSHNSTQTEFYVDTNGKYKMRYLDEPKLKNVINRKEE